MSVSKTELELLKEAIKEDYVRAHNQDNEDDQVTVDSITDVIIKSEKPIYDIKNFEYEEPGQAYDTNTKLLVDIKLNNGTTKPFWYKYHRLHIPSLLGTRFSVLSIPNEDLSNPLNYNNTNKVTLDGTFRSSAVVLGSHESRNDPSELSTYINHPYNKDIKNILNTENIRKNVAIYYDGIMDTEFDVSFAEVSNSVIPVNHESDMNFTYQIISPENSWLYYDGSVAYVDLLAYSGHSTLNSLGTERTNKRLNYFDIVGEGITYGSDEYSAISNYDPPPPDSPYLNKNPAFLYYGQTGDSDSDKVYYLSPPKHSNLFVKSVENGQVVTAGVESPEHVVIGAPLDRKRSDLAYALRSIVAYTSSTNPISIYVKPSRDIDNLQYEEQRLDGSISKLIEIPPDYSTLEPFIVSTMDVNTSFEGNGSQGSLSLEHVHIDPKVGKVKAYEGAIFALDSKIKNKKSLFVSDVDAYKTNLNLVTSTEDNSVSGCVVLDEELLKLSGDNAPFVIQNKLVYGHLSQEKFNSTGVGLKEEYYNFLLPITSSPAKKIRITTVNSNDNLPDIADTIDLGVYVLLDDTDLETTYLGYGDISEVRVKEVGYIFDLDENPELLHNYVEHLIRWNERSRKSEYNHHSLNRFMAKVRSSSERHDNIVKMAELLGNQLRTYSVFLNSDGEEDDSQSRLILTVDIRSRGGSSIDVTKEIIEAFGDHITLMLTTDQVPLLNDISTTGLSLFFSSEEQDKIVSAMESLSYAGKDDIVIMVGSDYTDSTAPESKPYSKFKSDMESRAAQPMLEDDEVIDF